MDFFYIVIKSVVSIIVLFLLTKMMGRKQISQLNLYDYVVGITIGSVAAEISTNVDSNFFGGLIVMTVYSLVSIIISLLTEKSIVLRRFLTGSPIVIMENGQILEESLKKAKFDINDLLQEARISGYYDLSQINYAIMEANGTISFLPKKIYSSVLCDDLKLNVDKESIVSNVIIDGKIMNNNLKAIGKKEKWLIRKLEDMGYDDVDNIILAICNNNSEITVYTRNINKKSKKVLE